MPSSKYLYHYTDKESAKKIQQSGVLRPSRLRNGDCALGEGVYFTSKPPQCTSDNLMKNNYGGASSARRPKTQAYVRVEKDRVCARNGGKDLGRDVYVVHTTRDLKLGKAGVKMGERKRYARDAKHQGKYSA